MLEEAVGKKKNGGSCAEGCSGGKFGEDGTNNKAEKLRGSDEKATERIGVRVQEKVQREARFHRSSARTVSCIDDEWIMRIERVIDTTRYPIQLYANYRFVRTRY